MTCHANNCVCDYMIDVENMATGCCSGARTLSGMGKPQRPQIMIGKNPGAALPHN